MDTMFRYAHSLTPFSLSHTHTTLYSTHAQNSNSMPLYDFFNEAKFISPLPEVASLFQVLIVL